MAFDSDNFHDRIWCNARLATMAGGGTYDDGVIACRNGRTSHIGTADDLAKLDAAEILDCEGRWITPGLIDCHTHLIHAGDRAHEFERRLAGSTYEELARAGGGITSTVLATRAASERQLVDSALPRLDSLIAEGVTTIEIKSGYGLSLSDECKMLRAARALADHRAISIQTTFLGAHAVPPEYFGSADAYIGAVCGTMIPSIAGCQLADAVDAFCENVGFTADQVRRVFDVARAYDLPVKLHAEQLSNSGGATLAAEYGALSADHLEHLDQAGVAAMAQAGTVAVLLPGAFYFMRETHVPPIAALRAAGVPMAVATDCNPGTSPLTSILLAMNMAATLFRLTVDECLAGVTREAARALGILNDTGTLELDKYCDLAIWEVERPAELVYRMGANPLHARIWRGQ
jgi:imidazolonepropionase